jgi:CubicO group peptidase (beta-lactamase class C family)
MTSTEKLEHARVDELHESMRGFVESGYVPGLVSLVARGDDVHVGVFGKTTLEGTAAMRRDSIFRIASLTKPIAATAAMILVDDGKLKLDDAVDLWLPELANRRVLRRIDAQLDDTVPAKRPITVRDLLTLRLGIGSIMAKPGTYPIQKPIHDMHLGSDGPEYMLVPTTGDEWLRKLAELPLMYQPGERWTYNIGADVLGILVARASGTTFESFLRARLFGPLGMNDTAFSVPADKLDRLTGCYRFNEKTKLLEVFDSAEHSFWSRPPGFESGAGGLVSTVGDYLAFCRLLLNKGQHGGQRFVSEASVAAMTSDQVTPEQREGADLFFEERSSWGFGMSVDIHQGNPWNVAGRFGWDGGFGTSGYSDPKNDLVGILFTQRLMDSPEAPKLYESFWRGVYRTLGG